MNVLYSTARQEHFFKVYKYGLSKAPFSSPGSHFKND
jgi:hypothetical protein